MHRIPNLPGSRAFGFSGSFGVWFGVALAGRKLVKRQREKATDVK